MPAFLTSSLYKFVRLDDPQALRDSLLALCRDQGVMGTLLLATEGINGTIAGPTDGVRRVLAWLRSDPRLADLEDKQSWFDRAPFQRLKVRIKPEIVTLHIPGLRPGEMAGRHVEASEWHALVDDPDVVLIDTRNQYEVALGSFRRALDPGTRSFSELPDWVRQQSQPGGALAERAGRRPRVAMFCTGGIRCEKSTALLRSHGFDEVYHLRGGILKYLESVPESESRWQGECFVFDERVSVGHGLRPGPWAREAPMQRRTEGQASEPTGRTGSRRPLPPMLDDPLAHLLRSLSGLAAGERRIVGLAGPPGAGKSTLARRLADQLNQRTGRIAMQALGMDGFHLRRAELAARPDAQALLARRGAPWTFDPQALATALRGLREPDALGRASVWPGFSHAEGDPVPAAIEVPACVQLLLVEGLYLLHRSDGWDLRGLLDECIYLDTPAALARTRLMQRHQAVWQLDRSTARARIEANDERNARIVRRSRHRADWRWIDGS